MVFLLSSFHPTSWIALTSEAFSPRQYRARSIATIALASTTSNSGDASTTSSASSTSSTSTHSRTYTTLGAPICEYHQVTIPNTSPVEGTLSIVVPKQDVNVEDMTLILKDLLNASGMKQGTITVLSRHTTTAITINEREHRLAQDMAAFFLQLAPPDERSESPRKRAGQRYSHNDIDQRPDGEEEAQRCRENGWDIDTPEQLQAWRDQEPINAHSHLLSMLLGSSESIPVVDGKMVIGQWQSVLLVDLDGPRDRTVGIQLMGFSW